MRRSPSPPPTKAGLKVQSCELRPLDNMFPHNTFEIDEVDGLVVRRGQPFKLDLTLNRPFDKSTDDISFDFQTGTPRPFNICYTVSLTDGINRLAKPSPDLWL